MKTLGSLIAIITVMATIGMASESKERSVSLKDQLQARAAESAGKVDPEKKAVMQKAQKELEALDLPAKALKVGDKAPAFSLNNATGENVSLSSHLQQGPAVVMFYRGGWCPYCNLALKAYQQHLPAIKEAGGSLIAISPEKPDNSLSTKEKNALGFEVLSDTDNAVARQFGIVFPISEELDTLYNEFGFDVASYNGAEKAELPLPATYVIDTGGTIRYAFVEEDYRQRAEPTDVVKTLLTLKAEQALTEQALPGQ